MITCLSYILCFLSANFFIGIDKFKQIPIAKSNPITSFLLFKAKDFFEVNKTGQNSFRILYNAESRSAFDCTHQNLKYSLVLRLRR